MRITLERSWRLEIVNDANCSLAFGKLYLSKVPMTAVDVLHDRVLSFYEDHGVTIEHLLTDNGRETCGKPLSHRYELYLAIQQIECPATPRPAH